MITWRQETNHLCCNPSFHGRKRYDGVIIKTGEDEWQIAQLIFMFCIRFGDQVYALGLMQPMKTPVRNIAAKRMQIDQELGLCRVKVRNKPWFFPLHSIVRGILLSADSYPYKDAPEYLAVHTAGTGDLFLRLRKLFPEFARRYETSDSEPQ